MNERDKELAKQAGWPESLVSPVIMAKLKEFADSIRADTMEAATRAANMSWSLVCKKMVELEREKVAAWMMQRGYATGHGDTIEDLLQELDWQVAERERKACLNCYSPDDTATDWADKIRARGNT